MLPRIAELFLFGILPFLVGSVASSSNLPIDDEFSISEVGIVEDVDGVPGSEDTASLDSAYRPTKANG